MSIVWVQEMEYRERVIFPRRSREEGQLVNHMIVVFDAAGAGMATRKLLPYLKPTASLNSTYYPESVKKILVVNAPGLVSFLYNFVKPMMPETTQKKVNFVSSNGRAELLALVGGDPALVPREFGGSAAPKAQLLEAFEVSSTNEENPTKKPNEEANEEANEETNEPSIHPSLGPP